METFDQNISSGIAFTAVSIMVMTGAWWLLNYVWLRPKKLEKLLREQGFKGNPYTLWHGDLKEMRKMRKEAQPKSTLNLSDDILPYVIPFENQLIHKFGKKVFTWIGTTPRVIIMNPDMIKDVLTKYNVFQKPKSHPLARNFLAGLVSREGEQWVKHRKMLNPAFMVEKLKLMLPEMLLSCTEMVSKWEALVSARAGQPCDVDICPYIQSLSADVISRTAFGSSYEQGTKIFQLLKDQTKLVSQSVLFNYPPGWRFLPTKTNRRTKNLHREIKGLLKDLIIMRIKACEAGEGNKDDLLGILLDSNNKMIQEHGHSNNLTMTLDDIIKECKLFYFAGQETTSNLLLWTIILLASHQKWQTLAREEVLQVFGKNKPHFDGLNHLKIITVILNEVLRLYPPVTLQTRIIWENTKLGDITLPNGVEVMLPTILVHHDKELWGDDAKEFKPERFYEGIAKATKGQTSFFPFSSGPRICIGQNFAMVEAKLAMALILQQFSWELSPFYVHFPFPSATIQPQCGANIILSKI